MRSAVEGLQVQDAAVAVYTDDSTGKDLLVAFVAPAIVNVQALDLAFRRSFPLYMVPAIYQPVPSIPRLSNGQVSAGLQSPFLIFMGPILPSHQVVCQHIVVVEEVMMGCSMTSTIQDLS